jgi:hypothetical protein
MRRREFFASLAAVAAWPLAARAQRSAMPIIGYLHPASPQGSESTLIAFQQGIKEEGYVEGQNVAIEYRWAHGVRHGTPPIGVSGLQTSSQDRGCHRLFGQSTANAASDHLRPRISGAR